VLKSVCTVKAKLIQRESCVLEANVYWAYLLTFADKFCYWRGVQRYYLSWKRPHGEIFAKFLNSTLIRSLVRFSPTFLIENRPIQRTEKASVSRRTAAPSNVTAQRFTLLQKACLLLIYLYS
jgi:hypothetical protein